MLHSENAFCVELHHRYKGQRIEEFPEAIWENAVCEDGTFRYTVTKEMLKKVTAAETLSVYAVAVQRYGLDTAVDAWSVVKADI